MRHILFITAFLISAQGWSWGNGQAGNAQTNTDAECADPPYSTHDYVADHALHFLPAAESAWLMPRRHLFLLGTEAPDNNDIPTACASPGTGYDDRWAGHSVAWENTHQWAIEDGDRADRAAARSEEEYQKAVTAFGAGNLDAAAYYLGAMAHYIGDVSQYGHTYPDEDHHGDYERWVGSKTPSRNSGGLFDSYMSANNMVLRKPYAAVKFTARRTFFGGGEVLSAQEMDSRYAQRNSDDEYKDSVGNALNYAANQIADVLHRFYVREVE